MTGRHLIGVPSQETVAVACHVVLGVPLASMPDLDVGGVRVGGPEVSNAHRTTG
jgi:hypothetical protein